MRFSASAIVLISSLVVVCQSTVQAALTFDLTWGPGLTGSASAVGTVTIDETALLNPTNISQVHSDTPFVLAFEMTVTGASSGNGTFTLGDFTAPSFVWLTQSAGIGPLDLSMELFGQPTEGGPFGTDKSMVPTTGDINVFSSTGGPTGVSAFTARTASGLGDPIVLTSFKPAVTPIPAPGALALALAGMASLSRFYRRRR